jgi:ribosomal protein S27AE
LYVLYSARQAGLEIQTIPVRFGARHHGVSRWAFSWRSRLKHIRATIMYVGQLSRRGTGERSARGVMNRPERDVVAGDDRPRSCPRCGTTPMLFTPNARRDPYSAVPVYEAAWQCTRCGYQEFLSPGSSSSS